MTSDDGTATVGGSRRHTTLAASRLAPNPGPMTLDGTNSYVLAAPGSTSVVVVDPGPSDEAHLVALAGRPVALVLITHHHLDHTAASERFHEMTGAPVRALDPACCVGGEPLVDGESIEVAGLRIRVVATPGHTADSVCFLLPDDSLTGGVQTRASVLTGDTVLGRGTTVIAHPDGELGAYFASLEVLAGLGAVTVLPAHGPVLPDLSAVVAEYTAHRRGRLAQVQAALRALGDGAGAGAEQIVELVYADIDPALRSAAVRSVAAQLAYLRSR